MHFNILQHFAIATLFGHLQEKSRTPEPRPTLSASLRSRNACQEFGYFIRKFTGKMPRPKAAARTLCEPTPPKLTSTFHKSRVDTEIYWKNAAPQIEPRTRTHISYISCEPAQSKCKSTFHKSHFIRKFTGKMPRPSWGTLIKHRPLRLLLA